MRLGTIHAAVIIPADFSRDIKAGTTASVHMILSPGRLLVLSDIGINIAKAVATFGGKVTGRVLATQGLPVMQRPALVQPLSFSWSPMHNPWLTYGDMILPALLAIILLQLVLVGSAAATASEFSTDGWREVFTGLRSGSTELVAGKLVMFVAVFLGFALLLRLTIIPLFDIRITGSATAIILLLVTAIAAATAMGLLAGSFFRHRISTFIVLGFTSYPFFMLSGYAWPDAQLPVFLRALARLLPTTPFLKGVLHVTQAGGGLVEAVPSLLNLSVLLVLYGVLARMRFAHIARRLR
jgi:ABC-2 type transport system permease protein